MDIRRELVNINRHFDWMQKTQGDVVIWYEFIPFSNTGSRYDDVYDEGIVGASGRKFKNGKILPILRIQEREDQKRAIPEGRLPFQNIMIFVSAKDMRNAGIDNVWEYESRINDMFKWDSRYYSIHDYMVRGRLRGEVYYIVEGIQVYVDQEMVNDPGPVDNFAVEEPWPTGLPILG